ncbi:UPF0316 protein [Bacteroidota bacterium]|nr:UPF0316 protein [Bacteroidota bacterium]
MVLQISAGFDFYSWLGLPLMIFFSRVCDVTLGTMRNLMVGKGYRKLAPILGFFEVLIWIVVVSQVMKNLNNFACYIGWAGGFAAGTYIGLVVEGKIALGLQVVRIITHKHSEELIKAMVAAKHGVTIVDAHGAKGPVKMIYMVVKRKTVKEVVQLISEHDSTAFYSIEDIKAANAGVFRDGTNSTYIGRWLGIK